ncbi:MAG TPA: 50S ribosomal protein L21 [Gemmataceae bacterium]
MYAIFEDGSRQYRVSVGDRVRLDHRDVEVGSRVELGRVLLYADGDDTRVGQPLVDGARVLATVLEKTSVKTYVQKFRRRKNYRRLKGHRQPFIDVQIRHILLPGQEPPPEEPAPPPEHAEAPPAGPPPEAPPEGAEPGTPPQG